VRTSLQDLLASGEAIIADGAMGTMLFQLGLNHGDAPELWNVAQPEKVRSVHRAYIEAGAQIVLTNSLGGGRLRLGRHDLSDRAAELNKAAAQLARAEADAADRPVVVAGSIGPIGEILAPWGTLAFEDAMPVFAEQAGALVEGGVDVLWIETMSDLEEVRAAVEGCRQAAPRTPVVTTMTFDTGGRTMMGVSPEQALETLKGFDVLALGGNCGKGPTEIEAVIAKMHAADPEAILVAKANAGAPRMEKGTTVYDATPEIMADHALKVRKLGARIIGACCGSTPDHIRAIARALRKGD
jgi:5-methyltetrahydrofolate--homocysteine methyltransferase